MLRFLLVLALVFGLTTPATAQAVTPRLRGEDPLALVGWWRVPTTGETVVIDPSRFEVRSGTGTAEGSWVGDSTGRFLVRADREPPKWLGAAAGFVANGPDRVLLDRAGAPVARLVPASAGTAAGADPARPPSDLELRARGPVAPLPGDLTPIGDFTGRWIPVDDVADHPAYVEFAADGTWTGSDGCTPTGGSWLAGPDGAFLATARTLMTFVACPGVGVAPQVGAARRIGTDGPTVILMDADGTPVGHFRRA
jgi:hypothetical protein